MSTAEAVKNKTCDIAFIALFAVLIAILLLDIHTDGGAVYYADLCSISVCRGAGRQGGTLGGPGLHTDGSCGPSGVRRIFGRDRHTGHQHGRIYHRIFVFRAGYVGAGNTSWQKDLGASLLWSWGLIVCYAFGTALVPFSVYEEQRCGGPGNGFGMGVFPFIIPDLVKNCDGAGFGQENVGGDEPDQINRGVTIERKYACV